ncbi:MAG: thiopurine S-methyltransferase [Bdellovibrionota bacterium]
MDAQFWIDRWTEGATAFHQTNFHDFLVKYFPQLEPRPGERVLVPLCGKSKDLLWLSQLNLEVQGFELYEKAIEAFFVENELPAPTKSSHGPFTVYSLHNLSLHVGDFFSFEERATFSLVYDRAALVALPADLRKRYAKKLSAAVAPSGKQLLISYTYDPEQLAGPPFSVDETEIQRLYSADFSIRVLESRPAKEPKLAAAHAIETAYLWKK